MPRERTDAGTFTETVSLEDVLAVFDDVRGPVITSSDVADHLECTTEAARQKLTRLYDRGRVDKRKTGRTTVWWLVDDTRARDAAREATRESTTDDTTPASTATGDAWSDVLPELDLPGRGANLEGRRDAVRAIYEYLKTHGEGQKSDFKDVVDVDATGYGSFKSFYTNCVDDGAILADLPGVRSPGEGGHTYTYTDPGGER